MKRYLFVCLLMVVVISCDKQDISDSQSIKFIKFYSNYPEFSAADVVEVDQTGYAILGTTKTFSHGTQLCLIRTDEFGNTIDSARFYGGPLEDQAYGLKVLPDKGFALLGSTRNPVTEKLEVNFIRTDSVGDILWSRTIGGSENIEAKHFEVDDLGSFIMTGYCDVALKGKQIWWFGLAEDGSDLWPDARTHGYNKDDEGSDLQILDNGSLVITGSIKGNYSDNAFVLKTNELGTFDAVNYKDSTFENGACIRALDENNFLVLGTKYTARETGIFLKKVSFSASETHVDWSRTFGSSVNDIGKCMITSDNMVYILGTTGTTETHTAISLITADYQGNQKNRSDFGLGSQLSGCAFQRTSDDGFIIVGTNKHADNSISVALIKTGPDATF